MKTITKALQHSLLSLAFLAAFAVPSAHAATITVDTTADTVGGAGCSLRDAVISINTATTQPSCTAVGAYDPVSDTIILPSGNYNLTLTGLDESWAGTGTALDPYTVVNAPDATKGDIDIERSVRIIGAGSDLTTIQWDASVANASRDRVFHIYTPDTVTVNVALEGLTIKGGYTTEEYIADGAPGSDPLVNTKYYLRRAGGGLAIGPAANVVQIDPALAGSENSAGRGGSLKPGESDPGGATFNVTLNGVEVLANHADGDGGGLYIAAQTTATNIVLSNNTSMTNGGGIYNEADTTITNSTISGNTSEGGGGLFATGSNSVTIEGSTLSGNTAVGGGALSSRSGVTVNMVNSTVSGNIGSDVGAGLYTNGAMNLNFVTIAKNISAADSSTAGSGINTFPSGGGAITLKNVILQGNLRGATGTIPANCGGTGNAVTVDSQGHNLSSDTTCDNTTWLNDSTDLNNVDPKLDVLAFNSPGTTQTHALLAGSPALGAGLAGTGVTVDQRGIARDATPDIGAYEVPTTVPLVPPYSSGGGGGCTMNPNAQFDGGLLAMLAAAMGGLMLRRRRSAVRK
jgi:CSLREA domain-containing protein